MTSCLLIEVETILEKSVESVINYEKVVFEQLLEKSSPKIVLFGCGNLGKKCLEGLRTVGTHIQQLF